MDLSEKENGHELFFDTHEMKIVKSNIEDHKYACISYLWNKPSIPTPTLNWTDPSKGIFWHVTSATKEEVLNMIQLISNTIEHRYIWMDILCMNQDNSDELKTKIRHMGKIYANADVCLAFPGKLSCLDTMCPLDDNGIISEWFARVWTLQETILPQKLYLWDGLRKQWLCKRECYWMLLQLGPLLETTNNKSFVDIHTALNVLSNGAKSLPTRIFQQAMTRKCLIPEDHIYGVLGLYDTHLNSNLEINYKKGLTHAIKDLISAMDTSGVADMTINNAFEIDSGLWYCAPSLNSESWIHPAHGNDKICINEAKLINESSFGIGIFISGKCYTHNINTLKKSVNDYCVTKDNYLNFEKLYINNIIQKFKETYDESWVTNELLNNYSKSPFWKRMLKSVSANAEDLKNAKTFKINSKLVEYVLNCKKPDNLKRAPPRLFLSKNFHGTNIKIMPIRVKEDGTKYYTCLLLEHQEKNIYRKIGIYQGYKDCIIKKCIYFSTYNIIVR